MTKIYGRIINVYYTISGPNVVLNWVVRNQHDEKKTYRTIAEIPARCYAPASWMPQIRNVLNSKKYYYERVPNAYFVDYEEEVYQISTKLPANIKVARIIIKKELGETFDLLQADIPFVRVYMIEHQIHNYIELTPSEQHYYTIKPLTDQKIINSLPSLHVYYFDLEHDDRKGVPKPLDNIFFTQLLSFSGFYKDQTDFYTDLDQKKLAVQFYEATKDMDVLVAYNGDNYDFPAIKKLIKKVPEIKYLFDYKRFAWIDFMRIFIQRHKDISISTPFVKLDDLAWIHLRKRKYKTAMGIYESFEAFHNNNNPELALYNDEDVYLMVELEAIFGFINLQLELANIVGLTITECVHINRMPDTDILRRARLRSQRPIFRSKLEGEIESDDKYMGAIVLDPEPGFHDNAIIIDLKSLYNRVIQSRNISPETWNPLTRLFDKRENGLFPEGCVDAEKRRNIFVKLRNESTTDKETKRLDVQQYGMKVLLLLFYGLLGMKRSRYYNKDVSEQITQFSKMMLVGEEVSDGVTKKVKDPISGKKIDMHFPCTLRKDQILVRGAKQVIEEMGMKILYGDSDSLFFQVPISNPTRRNIEMIYALIIKEINKSYNDYFADLGVAKEFRRISMEMQGYYSFLALPPTKKNYFAFLLYDGDKQRWLDKPKPYWKGLPIVRGSSTQFTKNSLIGMIMLLGKMHQQGGFNEERMVQFLKKQKKILESGKIDRDLVFKVSTKSSLDEYDQTKKLPVHIRAAKILADQDLFTWGQKIEYVVSDNTKEITPLPVAKNKIPIITKKGYEYYWDTAFFNFAEPFLSLIFNISKIKNDLKGQKSLGAFF